MRKSRSIIGRKVERLTTGVNTKDHQTGLLLRGHVIFSVLLPVETSHTLFYGRTRRCSVWTKRSFSSKVALVLSLR